MTPDRLYPSRPLLAASVACFRGDRVLLTTRSKPPMEHLYSLPGGLVEPGETLSEAALRELREETGIVAKLVGFVAPVEIIERDPDGRVRLHIVIAAHAARWLSGEARTGSEAREIRWVTQAEVETLPATPGLAAVLDSAFALVPRDPA